MSDPGCQQADPIEVWGKTMPAQSLWGVLHVQGLQRYGEQQTLFLDVLGTLGQPPVLFFQQQGTFTSWNYAYS